MARKKTPKATQEAQDLLEKIRTLKGEIEAIENKNWLNPQNKIDARRDLHKQYKLRDNQSLEWYLGKLQGNYRYQTKILGSKYILKNPGGGSSYVGGIISKDKYSSTGGKEYKINPDYNKAYNPNTEEALTKAEGAEEEEKFEWGEAGQPMPKKESIKITTEPGDTTGGVADTNKSSLQAQSHTIENRLETEQERLQAVNLGNALGLDTSGEQWKKQLMMGTPKEVPNQETPKGTIEGRATLPEVARWTGRGSGETLDQADTRTRDALGIDFFKKGGVGAGIRKDQQREFMEDLRIGRVFQTDKGFWWGGKFHKNKSKLAAKVK